jgi:16S rRNA (uracil1498-N3)-methyltransferase
MGNVGLQKTPLKMHRFFISKTTLKEKRATVTGGELEHMTRVLRLRPGDRIVLFDDGGEEHEGVIRSYGPHDAEIEILNSVRPQRESQLEIVLAQALGKGDKMDLVVEKSTELGVSSIAPFLSSRTVPKPDTERGAARHERWRKIALSAAKQSGRTKIPDILELSDFSTLVSRSWPSEEKLLFEPGKARDTLRQVVLERPRINSILLTIGPEGGFTPEELTEATEGGFRIVQLGTRILRTETAAVSALSIVQFMWGDL